MFCFLSVQKASGQSEDNNNIFKDERLTIGVGIGVDYTVLGPKVKFRLREDLFGVASFSYPGFVAGVAGLEYQYPKLKNQRICPYAFLIAGSDVQIRLFKSTGVESKVFNTVNIGLGSKFQFFKGKNRYFTAGISYRFYSKENIENFVEDFNQRNQLDREISLNPLLFSFGYHFIINIDRIR